MGVLVRGDYHIGEWLIHPGVNCIERDGETVHLEPKVMQVLVTLAAEAGEVVTREHLHNAVWPDVFVGEDVLIRAISEIRRAFADNPKSPHTIQTVPKVGYRLIAPVSEAVETPSHGFHTPAPYPAEPIQPESLKIPDKAAATQTPAAQATLQHSPRVVLHSRGQWPLWVMVGVLILAVAFSTVVAIRSNHRPSKASGYRSHPLTTYAGSELQPNFSPDGSAVAFVWLKAGEHNGHIYVKLLSSEAPSRLTQGTTQELSPVWSPDGRWIAFIRHDEVRTSVFVIPAIGGSEREVYTLTSSSVWEYGGLAWTPDGEKLIFPQRAAPEAPSKLVEVALHGDNVRPLTNPPQSWNGDWTPVVSPDGKKLAFVRGPEGSGYDIYVMNLPDGVPQRITNDGRLVVGLTWSADSSSIVFSSNRSGSISLWRVPAGGGSPEHEPAGGDNAYGPSIARQGHRLVYSHGSAAWTILAANLDGKSQEAEILTSSEQDASPHVSPGGNKIAFQSWRSGSQEIWTAGIDGSNPIQVTTTEATAGSPSWSPDGHLIAFDARLDSFAHIYSIDANGGTPRTITNGSFNDIVPSWSLDGRSIYFGSNRSGSWQIWKIPSDGTGTAQQVTSGGGMVALESKDAHWLYFTRYARPGIWRCPIGGGPEHQVFAGPPGSNLNYWTLAGNSIYSLFESGGKFTLDRVDPETGRAQTVYILKHDPTPFAGVSLTPDGKRIIFAELSHTSSGLTLVENFE